MARFKNYLVRLLDKEFGLRVGAIDDTLVDPANPGDGLPPPTFYPQFRWKNTWVQQTYYANDCVRDGSWTMAANKTTNERPAPQPVGNPFFVYDGTGMIGVADLAKQVIFGNRYTFSGDGWVAGYRIDVVAGNNYRVFVVTNPLTFPVTTNIGNFTAINTGWLDILADPFLVLTGAKFDLLGYVTEPDPTPVTFNGNWNYFTPNNNGAPIVGQILQANSTTDLLNINYIDADAGDRTAVLQALNVGDIIEVQNVRWAIQSATDIGAYIVFGVSPAAQAPLDILSNFVFETTVATPITTGDDPNYWGISGKTVEGLFIVDGDYDDIVPNDTAYGTDIFIQPASISDDWDIVAVSEGVSGGGGSIRTEIVAQASSFVDQNPPGLGVAQQVALEVVDVTTPAFTIDTAGLATCLIADEYTIKIKLAIGREGVAQESQIYVRALLNGTPLGNSTHTIVDNPRIEIPQFIDLTQVFDAGDTFALEFIRDTDGHDSGGLRAGVPDVVGWADSPSASITILRTYL